MVAFVPASGRAREVVDELVSENAFLRMQLLDTRRALQAAQASIAALQLSNEGTRLAQRPLSAAAFGQLLGASQVGAAAARAESGMHFHSPVIQHFHFPTAAPLDELVASAASGAPPAAGDASSTTAGAPPAAGGAPLSSGGARPGPGSGGGRWLRLGPTACANLKNRDKKGRSDPFIRVRPAAGGAGKVESARKDDELNPRWEEVLTLELLSDEASVLIEVWDWDHKGNDALGFIELPILARPSGGPETFKLRGNSQEVTPGVSTITLTWRTDGTVAGPAPSGSAARTASIGEAASVAPLPSAVRTSRAAQPRAGPQPPPAKQ
ncbi:hypothetical protein T492DRAFT_1057193 [Pavlovales sp. CCMP2436]|nr:hypothetical protein T492DRAFT_1057193 [Pavlovales sp. CCMP2436]